MKKLVFMAATLFFVLSLFGCSSQEAVLENSPPTSIATSTSALTVLEQDGIQISYTGTTVNDSRELKVNFVIHNDSDKPVFITAKSLSVDGVKVSGVMSASVPAGKQADSNITIFAASLKENNLNTDSLSTAEIVFEMVDESTTKVIAVSEAVKIDL